jgi:helix-turn-helix protein
MRDNLGLVLRELRKRPDFGALSRGAWSAFIAIACHWQAHQEAWPSQQTIASFCGYSSRAVRDAISELQRHEVIRLRRAPPRGVTERIYYSPGQTTVRAVSHLQARYPPRAEATSASGSHHAEVPALATRKPLPTNLLRIKNQEEQRRRRREITEEDRETARTALGEHFQRRHPGRPAPRFFDDRDVENVARCVAATEGDRETKLRSQRDAIEGAFRASRRAPTVRYVWEKLEHFFEHAERGRRPPTGERQVAPAAESTECVPVEQLEADLVRLFGASWKARR